uniref:Cysteine-rich transmembrane CYSTM domain-containing protein n=1 Tax=Panagrolaimus sp. PS1159 TaxID=55785 RepID=A0AC35EUY3_9BILA
MRQHPYQQNYDPYPYQPIGSYPAGQYYPQQQPTIIYRDAPRDNGPSANTCWLISLLTLCCGCLIGDVCCDSDVCCCIIPCALPRFR